MRYQRKFSGSDEISPGKVAEGRLGSGPGPGSRPGKATGWRRSQSHRAAARRPGRASRGTIRRGRSGRRIRCGGRACRRRRASGTTAPGARCRRSASRGRSRLTCGATVRGQAGTCTACLPGPSRPAPLVRTAGRRLARVARTPSKEVSTQKLTSRPSRRWSRLQGERQDNG